jgi:hypothetical protein
MDAFTISVIVIGGALGVIALLAFAARRSFHPGIIHDEQPDVDTLMRRALQRLPLDIPPRTTLVKPSVRDDEGEKRPKPVQERPEVVVPPVTLDSGAKTGASVNEAQSDTHAVATQESPQAEQAPPVVTDVVENTARPTGSDESTGPTPVTDVIAPEQADTTPIAPSAKQENPEPSAFVSPPAVESETSGSSAEIPAAAAASEAASEAGSDPVPPGAPSVQDEILAASVEKVVSSLDRRKPQAVHRDRRGRRRRQPPAQETSGQIEKKSPAVRAPAEARLRLVLHPIQQTAQLSLVLSRPDGFPKKSSIEIGGEVVFEAYDESRYDDVDIEWRANTLQGELRLANRDGYQWVRSARRAHIFSTDPVEAGLMSVSAARTGAEHAIACKLEDAALISDIAASTGSPALITHVHWKGIPSGWCVFSGYIPKNAAGPITDITLRPLDPGYDLEIRLSAGLPIRPGVFAEGHPPIIEIDSVPEGVSVFIDGEPAQRSSTGGWETKNWALTGPHLIDVVPGPSLSYEIAADPADNEGWALWDAHEARFSDAGPWSRAWICGASVSGPAGETVVAREARQTLIALGSRGNATTLSKRGDAEVSVGLIPTPPAFLFSSSGTRRHQGEIIWLGLERTDGRGPIRKEAAMNSWSAIVRYVASRRVPLQANGSATARDVWRKTVRRARDWKRRQS